MTKTFREFLKDDYNIQCVDDEFWNSTIQCNICSDKISDYAEEYAKQEEEELKAKLPTEEEIKKLFDKFQLMVNGKCIGIPTWNYDDLAKSIRSLIEEKLKGEVENADKV